MRFPALTRHSTGSDIMIHAIEQFIIPVCTCAAVWLLSRPDFRRRRWGPVVGLVGQPFWFLATISAEQWGIVVVATWFTGVYVQATYRDFFGHQSQEPKSRSTGRPY